MVSGSHTAPDTRPPENVSALSGWNWQERSVITRKSFLAALAVALATPGAADARRGRGHGGDHDEALEARARREALPLPRILEIARDAVPGEVLEVELEREHGRLIYEVEILSNSGRVRKVEIDAQTGAVLEVENE